MKSISKLIPWYLLAFALAGCAPSPSFLAPTSAIAAHEANLFKVVLILGAAVLVFVEGGFIWSIIRDRKRDGDETPPPQIVGNRKVEFIWTAVPILLVITLFTLTVQTMGAVAAPRAAAQDLNLHVVGHRWWWEFYYPDLGITTANELHVPAGTNVQITLDSVDVIHSFWIPQLSGKTDVIPGQTNHMWFNAGQPGTFLGQCAEFCGTEHALMHIAVVVDSQEDFKAWAANQQKPAAPAQTADEQAGLKLVAGTCAGCHSIDPDQPEPKTGPNLTHLFSRSVFGGGSFELTEDNLRRWLTDTQVMKPANDMQITLRPEEVDQVMAYLKLLK
jgi:cytochrome c oxidase subunit 2